MKQILITGVTGFIGRALCGKLAHGNKVIGMDINRMSSKGTSVEREQVDVADESAVAAIKKFLQT